ncbi:MAG: hypothetical protein ACTHJ7_09670 [Candidatus Nitrosocosmicus sp.]
MLKNNLIIAIFFITIITATISLAILLNQNVFADKGGSPNDHASFVAKPPGATANQPHFQDCKESSPASTCSHLSSQVGKWQSKYAHIINSPNN